MVNKKFVYFIIVLLLIHFIISYSFDFYNKKIKVNFSIENFEEKTFTVDSKKLTYYEKTIYNNKEKKINNLIFIHSPFESSMNSKHTLYNTFNIEEDKENNFRIILIDLPAHGKSFKIDNYDYSFRNISSDLVEFLSLLNIEDASLACDKFSSTIGLSMISLNDKIFSNLVLINPIFKYNPSFENLKLSLKNELLTLNSFMFLNYKKNKDWFENYKSSYFNLKNSSNKYVRKMIKESTPLEIKDVYTKTLKVFALITDKTLFDSSYLKSLSNSFSAVYFVPKQLITEILKR